MLRFKVNRRKLRAFALAAGLLAVVVPLVLQSAAGAVPIVICSDGEGSAVVDPEITFGELNNSSVSGSGRYDTCVGGGVTFANATFEGTILEATCVPLTETYIAAEGAGTWSMNWGGGLQTDGNWIVAAGITVTPGVATVVRIVGHTTSGAFHPALMLADIFIDSVDAPCLEGTKRFFASSPTFVLAP